MTAQKRRKPGRPKGSGPRPEFTGRVDVPVKPSHRAAYQAAAAELNVSLAEWVREACESALAAQGKRS